MFSSGTVLPLLDASGLIAAHLVLAGLLLSLNIYSVWNWTVKTVMNALVLVFFWVTYQSWPGILGWRTERDLPRQFYLHAVAVNEPDRIYLWGSDLERGLGQAVPRAYALPYSPSLHDSIDQAERKWRNGLPVIGQLAPQVVPDED